MTNDFDIDKARAELIALRVKHGPDSPVGHRCSNLIEKLETLANVTDREHRIRLQKSISRTLAGLAELTTET